MTRKESVEVGNESEEAGNDVLEFLEFGIFCGLMVLGWLLKPPRGGLQNDVLSMFL